MYPGEAWSVDRKDFRNVLLRIGSANQTIMSKHHNKMLSRYFSKYSHSVAILTFYTKGKTFKFSKLQTEPHPEAAGGWGCNV